MPISRYARGHVRGQGAEPGVTPAILLRESYGGRQGQEPDLANLTAWPEAKVDALTGAEGPAAARRGPGRGVRDHRSLPHGHVAAVLGTARRLGLEELIDPVPSRQRDLVTAMAVAQVIAPDSKLAIARGLREETAATSWARSCSWGPAMRTTCTRRWTTWLPGRTRSRTRSRPAPGRGHPGAVRRVLRRVRGPDLPARRDRPPERRGAGPAADRLRAADQRGRRRSRSRCSRATPATRRPWPPR